MLAYFIKKSPVRCETMKLLRAYEGEKILSDYIQKPIAKIGTYIIFLFYTLVMIMHLVAFIII